MIVKYEENKPEIHDTCFIAKSADLIGNINIGANSSIWYNCVLRGDENKIIIGKNTNIQDGTIIHINKELDTIIGDNVTVGHNAIIHACKIGNNVLIGMGAIILDGAEIEDNVIVGAGSLIPPGKKIPAGSLVIGSPAKVKRDLSETEINELTISAIDYVGFSKKHKNNSI